MNDASNRHVSVRSAATIVAFGLCGVLAWRVLFPQLDRTTHADASAEATALVTEFRVNQPAAHLRYAGKIVDVHGDALRVQVLAGAPVLSIGVLFTHVDCRLQRDALEVSSRIRLGQPVRVKGRVVADGANVTLDPCVLR